MPRAVGLLNVVVAGAWGAASVWVMGGWQLAGFIAGAVSLAQLLGGVALLLGRGPRLARVAAALAVAGAVVLVAIYGHSTLVIAARYGAEAKDIALMGFGGALGALPWLVGLPLWQLFATRGGGGPGPGAAVGVAVLAGAVGWSSTPVDEQPAQRWSRQPEGIAAAEAAFARWSGSNPGAALPVGSASASVLLTPWSEGRPGTSVRGDGATLQGAVEKALAALPPPAGERSALVLDLALERWDGAAPLGPDSGALTETGGSSPSAMWRPKGTKRTEILPGLWVPMIRVSGDATRFDSVLVDDAGARPLVNGWTAAPPLSAEALREAALAGGRMLVRHQDAEGRYAYIIAGPSGQEQGGYNFPRHAGVTWFLARLVARTGDPEIAAATARGLSKLQQSSSEAPVGGAYVRDPGRNDRKVWVGTTALAVLAAVSADHPMALPWGRFVAASVDAQGQVRGDLDLDAGGFLEQPRNPYGQGQVMLALAALARAGHEEFREPLLRAQRFMDGDYAPGAVGKLLVLDEHWACLASLAGRDATGKVAGWEICRGYVNDARLDTPTPGSTVHLSAGAAGGLAEAVVAAAVLDPEGPWTERALGFARMFLESAYRPGDAPLLGRPDALLGGFRDTVVDWDVRMDAVQHIGCALLGAEALLSAPAPGALP